MLLQPKNIYQLNSNQKIVRNKIYRNFLEMLNAVDYEQISTIFEAKLAAKAAKKGALSYSRIRFPMSSTEESEAEPARPWNRLLRSE